MRLTCPNCDAQYEVDDRAIPPAGRDVQCSNCGHAWYFYPPGAYPEDQDEDAALVMPDAAASGPAPSGAVASASVPSNAGWDDDDADIADDTDPAPELQTRSAEHPGSSRPSGSETAVPARGRRLDESVLAVLREEAEREAAARTREARKPRALEMQPDLGLADPQVRRRPEERIGTQDDRNMVGVGAHFSDDEDPAVAARRARRDVLPNIEAINSSLSASGNVPVEEPQSVQVSEPEAERRGFRLGFRVIVLLFVALLAIYAFSPQIGRSVPFVAAPLNGYVAFVDRLRTIFYEKVRSATGAPGLPQSDGSAPSTDQPPAPTTD